MSTRRALIFSFLDRYSALLLSIVSSMIIARLLTPEELGVFSVSMVFIMLVSSMRDLGAGQYLVQEQELTPERIRATRTVLLGTGLLMSLVVLLAAHPVALFFKEPSMVSIMCVIALNFAVNPFGSLTYAWLMREMRFDALAMMRFSASLAGAAISIALAYLDHGAISLAYGNLATTVVNALVSLRYRPTGLGWGLGWGEIRRVLGFGSRVSGMTVVLSIGAGAPEFLLGKLQSMTAAGLYSRGNGLAAMFQKLVLDATNAVALPMLAKSHRETGRIDEPLIRAISYVTALGWTFFLGIALLGYPLTRLLYGAQWDESVPLMRWIALGMAIGLPTSLCPHALIATGRAGQMLKTSLVTVPLLILCVGIGACFSLTGAGQGFIVAQVLAAPIWLRVCVRDFGMPPALLAAALGRSAAVALLTALVPLACVRFLVGLQPQDRVAPVVGSALLGLPLFMFALRRLGHPLGQELTWLLDKLPGRRRA